MKHRGDGWLSYLRCIAARLCMASSVVLAASAAEAAPSDVPRQRIVFVGDSITDGHTYPLLIEAAYRQGGRPVPVCINAGVAGDTAQGMLGRIDRDVLIHSPTLVTLSAGINDVLRHVPLDDYARDMRAIAVRLRREKVPLLIMTTTILGEKHAEADKKLAEFNATLKRIAAEEDARIADVNAAMQAARERGQNLLEEDQVHINPAGYRMMARAILDAMGEQALAVPEELKLALMPGVVKSWQVRAVAADEIALDETSLAKIDSLPGWKPIELPFTEPEDHWWMDQERQRGFAVSLGKRVGEGKKFLAKTTIESETTHKGYMNVGAQVEKVWLNGKLVYETRGWTGWHAGKERISVTINSGANILVVETGDTYFISLTPDNAW